MSLKKASRTKSLSLSDDFPFKPSPQRSAVKNSFAGKRVEDTGKIFKYIDDNVIGKGVAFIGPFGRRKGILCFFFPKCHHFKSVNTFRYSFTLVFNLLIRL